MSASNEYQNQHQEVALLLPWLVNGSLEGEELQRVESHIRDCLTCRRELNALRKLSASIRGNSELDIAAATSFARLSSKMAEPAQQLGKSTVRRRWRAGLRGLGYAAVATLLAFIVLPRQLPTFTSLNQQYATLSSQSASADRSQQLRVVFAKTASAGDIDAILSQIHAQTVGEANSLGAISIRLDPEQGSPEPSQAIALLRNNPAILLAEPVLQP